MATSTSKRSDEDVAFTITEVIAIENDNLLITGTFRGKQLTGVMIPVERAPSLQPLDVTVFPTRSEPKPKRGRPKGSGKKKATATAHEAAAASQVPSAKAKSNIVGILEARKIEPDDVEFLVQLADGKTLWMPMDEVPQSHIRRYNTTKTQEKELKKRGPGRPSTKSKAKAKAASKEAKLAKAEAQAESATATTSRTGRIVKQVPRYDPMGGDGLEEDEEWETATFDMLELPLTKRSSSSHLTNKFDGGADNHNREFALKGFEKTHRDMEITTKEVAEDAFPIERILDHKTSGKDVVYLIKWQDYSSKHNTWEPEENIESDALDEYLLAVKNKAKHTEKRTLKDIDQAVEDMNTEAAVLKEMPELTPMSTVAKKPKRVKNVFE